MSLTLLLLPVALCGAHAGPAVATSPPAAFAATYALPSDSLRSVWEAGQLWPAFFDAVDRRRALWDENWRVARVPEDLAARARAAGAWRMLVITEPGCSDSANSVPYIARLVAQTAGLELRIIDSAAGKPWMELHRSADGRAATPTVLVLDEHFDIRGCWIEQPAALQAMWLPIVARGEMAQHVDEKMAWYAKDAGRETLRELVEVLEAAGTDSIICPGVGY
jgi:hypothetical protein